MNPQILQLLMSNPQMLASLIQQSQPMLQPTQQPSWKTADYYGPEAQREQYFKNMGVDTSPAPPNAAEQLGGFGASLYNGSTTLPPATPAPVPQPNFNPYGSGNGRSGFNSPFGRSMLQINPMSNPRPGRSMYGAQAPVPAPAAPPSDPNAGGPNNPFGSQNPFGAPSTPAYRRR